MKFRFYSLGRSGGVLPSHVAAPSFPSSCRFSGRAVAVSA